MKLIPITIVLACLLSANVFSELPAHDHRIGFGLDFDPIGGAVAYEHIKPDSFYVGVSTSVKNRSNLNTMIAGYNFSLSKKDTFTPAIGAANFYEKGIGTGWIPLITLEYKHRINDRFTIGACLGSVPKEIFNFTAGVPFSVHFGENRDWDVKIIPSYSHIRGKYLTSNTLSFGYSIGKSF